MEKILVVDDDSTSLAICRALLDTKYQLEMAKSGVEALGFLKSGFLPDAILMDMVMPGTNGMDLLKTLKQNEKWSDIPVLFLSSRDDTQFEVEGLKNGAADFLRKPVDPDLLDMKLEKQIYFAKLEKENQTLRERVAELQKRAE